MLRRSFLKCLSAIPFGLSLSITGQAGKPDGENKGQIESPFDGRGNYDYPAYFIHRDGSIEPIPYEEFYKGDYSARIDAGKPEDIKFIFEGEAPEPNQPDGISKQMVIFDHCWWVLDCNKKVWRISAGNKLEYVTQMPEWVKSIEVKFHTSITFPPDAVHFYKIIGIGEDFNCEAIKLASSLTI